MRGDDKSMNLREPNDVHIAILVAEGLPANYPQCGYCAGVVELLMQGDADAFKRAAVERLAPASSWRSESKSLRMQVCRQRVEHQQQSPTGQSASAPRLVQRYHTFGR